MAMDGVFFTGPVTNITLEFVNDFMMTLKNVSVEVVVVLPPHVLTGFPNPLQFQDFGVHMALTNEQEELVDKLDTISYELEHSGFRLSNRASRVLDKHELEEGASLRDLSVQVVLMLPLDDNLKIIPAEAMANVEAMKSANPEHFSSIPDHFQVLRILNTLKGRSPLTRDQIELVDVVALVARELEECGEELSRRILNVMTASSVHRDDKSYNERERARLSHPNQTEFLKFAQFVKAADEWVDYFYSRMARWTELRANLEEGREKEELDKDYQKEIDFILEVTTADAQYKSKYFEFITQAYPSFAHHLFQVYDVLHIQAAAELKFGRVWVQNRLLSSHITEEMRLRAEGNDINLELEPGIVYIP